MTRRTPFGQRPSVEPSMDAWVRQEKPVQISTEPAKAEIYSARMTLDVSPDMRARIKVAAFQQGRTVTDILRELLEQHFPELDP